MPAGQADLAALKAHLDWYVVEEEQRRDITPELFALHAILTLAASAECRETTTEDEEAVAELITKLRAAKANGDPEKYIAMFTVAEAHRAASTLTALQAKAAELKAALEPFAAVVKAIDADSFPNDFIVHATKNGSGDHIYTLTAWDFRRAAALCTVVGGQ